MMLARPIRGLLGGALVVPLAYWIAMMVDASAHKVLLGLSGAAREFFMIVAFGVPLAVVVALIWGAPIIYVLHRCGALRAATVVVAGALGGALVALLFHVVQAGVLYRVRMPFPLGVGLGALAGGMCWWAGRGNKEPTETNAAHEPSRTVNQD